jgi:glucan phosphoethanolaminetransferase (alkaline phosphatase superfamily)
MQPAVVAAFLLFAWLWLPSLAILTTNQVRGVGDSLALLSLTWVILILPLLLLARPRLYFLCLFPLALLAGPMAFFTLAYGSVPGDVLIQAVVQTTPVEALAVVGSFWKGLVGVLIATAAYLLMAWRLPSRWTLSAALRKNVLAVCLAYLALALSTPLLANWVRIPFGVDFGALSMAFPVNVAMSLDRVMEERKPVPYASVSPRLKSGEPVLIVMVIGESLRPDHMHLYGYGRPTTPFLSARSNEVLAFRDVASTANATAVAVPNMIGADVPGGRANLTATLREAGFRTAWISNQGPVNGNAEADVTEYSTSGRDHFTRRDRALLPMFSSFVRQAGPRQFVTLHMLGSHIPYDGRYDAESRRFQPTLSDHRVSVPQLSDRVAVINSYDNTVIETDRFLHEVITVLAAEQRPAILIFSSDHGENLFDDGRRLFMHTQPEPTRYDIHVPLLVWMNPAYRAFRPQAEAGLRANLGRKIAHPALFPTILDLAGIDWHGKAAGQSLADPGFIERPRLVRRDLGKRTVEYESLR